MADRNSLRRALRTTFLLEDVGPSTERLRALVLATVVAIAFLVIGSVRGGAALTEKFGDSPFDFDYALRVISAGWFSPERTAPITVVDIDEQTHRAWGSQAVTPRHELARLLQVVTAARPAGVFVDIDLSWGHGAAVTTSDIAGEKELLSFLTRYRGPAPILFPKRIETSFEGPARAAVSPFDAVIAGNPRLGWTHAAFETDADGKVREWREWMIACTERGLTRFPAVPVGFGVVPSRSDADTGRSSPSGPTAGSCDQQGFEPAGPARRLLLGPRLTGNTTHALKPDAAVVSASLLLDAELARDDDAMFGGRTVFIGASHTSSGDLWLTPSGVYPGVELLASMTRFAPMNPEHTGPISRLVYRCLAVALFLSFAYCAWRLRALVAVAAATLIALTYLVIAVGAFDGFAAFEVVESAVLMMILYTALEATVSLLADIKAERRKSPGGLRSLGRALAAACLRRRD